MASYEQFESNYNPNYDFDFDEGYRDAYTPPADTTTETPSAKPLNTDETDKEETQNKLQYVTALGVDKENYNPVTNTDGSDIPAESNYSKRFDLGRSNKSREERFKEFSEAYKQAGADPKYFDFFAKLASEESGFNKSIQNLSGAPAYGYFQFMQGDTTIKGKRKSFNNIRAYANTDIETFRNDPVLQIKAAMKLAKEFMSALNDKDKKRAKELGLSDSALLAGAWAGGAGGVKAFLHKNEDRSDKYWSKDGKTGTTVFERMKLFNNYFKVGGKIVKIDDEE